MEGRKKLDKLRFQRRDALVNGEDNALEIVFPNFSKGFHDRFFEAWDFLVEFLIPYLSDAVKQRRGPKNKTSAIVNCKMGLCLQVLYPGISHRNLSSASETNSVTDKYRLVCKPVDFVQCGHVVWKLARPPRCNVGCFPVELRHSRSTIGQWLNRLDLCAPFTEHILEFLRPMLV